MRPARQAKRPTWELDDCNLSLASTAVIAEIAPTSKTKQKPRQGENMTRPSLDLTTHVASHPTTPRFARGAPDVRPCPPRTIEHISTNAAMHAAHASSTWPHESSPNLRPRVHVTLSPIYFRGQVHTMWYETSHGDRSSIDRHCTEVY